MYNLVISILFFSLFSIWLLFASLLALVGAFLPFSAKKLDAAEVKTSDTICRALFEKGKLTEDEYAFETEKVAESYDELIFKGYSFIVAPVIWMVKNSSAIDKPMLFLVHRWMGVHHFFFDNENHKSPALFDIALTKVCVLIAKGTGKSLSLFL